MAVEVVEVCVIPTLGGSSSALDDSLTTEGRELPAGWAPGGVSVSSASESSLTSVPPPEQKSNKLKKRTFKLNTGHDLSKKEKKTKQKNGDIA